MTLMLKDIRWCHQRGLRRRASIEEGIEEVGACEKRDSSAKFGDVFDVDFSAPSIKDRKKKPKSSPKFRELQPCSLHLLTGWT